MAAPASIAAPASVSADLAAQSGHHTGKASLDAAVVVRRGSFLRAGIAFDANGTCDNPGMMLTDVATGATLRMPFVDRDEGAALAGLTSDGLAMRARQRCDSGISASCGSKQGDASSGDTLFGATLHGGAFSTSVATSDDGSFAVISAYGDIGGAKKASAPNNLAAAKAVEQYAEMIGAGAGSPYYTVVVERTYDPSAGEVRAALAVWLPEDMPIGAYTLSLGCGQAVVGDGLPLVVLFNPYDATTAEVAPADTAATVQQGRADVIATPGLGSGFALSAPDQAAIDTLLEMIAAYPLAARQHPALVAQVAAKGRGPIQLTGRANYSGLRDGYPNSDVDPGSDAKAGGYDTPFIGGETNADVALWKATSAWNDATGHFDLWGAQLGKVGDGTWPFAGAARLRLRRGEDGFAKGTLNVDYKVERPGAYFLTFQVAGKSPASNANWKAGKPGGIGNIQHTVQDSFADGHTLRIIPPGAITAREGVYSVVSELLGSIADDVVVTDLTANKGGLVALVELRGAIKADSGLTVEVIETQGDLADLFDLLVKPGFGSKLGSTAKGGGAKYGQCWVFSGTLASAAKADGGGVKYGQCWIFSSTLKGDAQGGDAAQPLDVFLKNSDSTTNGGPLYTGSPWSFGAAAAPSGGGGAEAFANGTEAYEIVEFSGAQQSGNGVIPRTTGLWTWTSGTWSGIGGDKVTGSSVIFDGVAYRGIGGWTFDDSAAQDSSGHVAMSAGFTIPATGHFIDDWQGETAYLIGGDAGSGGTRVSATSSTGKMPDVFAGITFVQPSTVAASVDGVKVCAGAADKGAEPSCKTGSVADTGSAFRAYRNGGRGTCHFGKCFCYPAYGEALLRAAGIPTRSATNFDSAHEKAGFQIPAGAGPANAFLVRTTEKAGAGQPWYSFAPYAAYIVDGGGDKASIWNFHVWNATALKAHGESIWNFHVWTEAWVQSAKGNGPSWNAYDATAQEQSDGKVASIGNGFGGLDCSGECSLHVATQAAAKATGVPVDVLGEVLAKPANKPRELLHGRWDGSYDDGKQPSTWGDAAKPATASSPAP